MSICFDGVIAILFVCALIGMCRVCVFVCGLLIVESPRCMLIGLMWYVKTWMGSVGCFGGALFMGLGRLYGCEAALVPPSYV